ncbi:CGNR zinc finger domain-containing protein [Microbacterium enclense]|uniref:CGNR zinc finger domain-containing protein n=1 Tax=Microbacterium enclense TaxID=993073 RepID=UPI00343B2F0A
MAASIHRGTMPIYRQSIDMGRSRPARTLREGFGATPHGAPAIVAAALGIVAADAIEMLAGVRPGALALCASPTCRAAFFDTSRGRTRRWCDMNTCGNHEKKARLKAHRVS